MWETLHLKVGIVTVSMLASWYQEAVQMVWPRCWRFRCIPLQLSIFLPSFCNFPNVHYTPYFILKMLCPFQVPSSQFFQSGPVMQSLTEEIQSFSRTRLRKQCTRVTSLSGRRIVETWKGSTITVVEDPGPPERMLGYVPDTSWDLQVGTVRPYLLLGEWCIVTDSTTYKLNTNHCLIIWTNSLVVLLLMAGSDKLLEPVTRKHFAFTSIQKNSTPIPLISVVT